MIGGNANKTLSSPARMPVVGCATGLFTIAGEVTQTDHSSLRRDQSQADDAASGPTHALRVRAHVIVDGKFIGRLQLAEQLIVKCDSLQHTHTRLTALCPGLPG